MRTELKFETLNDLIIHLNHITSDAVNIRTKFGVSDDINPETDELRAFVCKSFQVGEPRDGKFLLLSLTAITGLRADYAIPIESVPTLAEEVSDSTKSATRAKRTKPS